MSFEAASPQGSTTSRDLVSSILNQLIVSIPAKDEEDKEVLQYHAFREKETKAILQKDFLTRFLLLGV